MKLAEAQRRDTLRYLIDSQRRESFRPEMLDQIPDEKALGVLIARYLRDPQSVLEVAEQALTDLNFHEEAARVRALIA